MEILKVGSRILLSFFYEVLGAFDAREIGDYALCLNIYMMIL